MKRFYLDRANDETGVSGTGFIAEGVELRDGRVVLCWLGNFRSTILYDNIEAVVKVHGHGGKTVVIYVDDAHFEPENKFVKPKTGEED